MTIEKAIEIKSRTGEEFIHTDPDEIDEADRLSIEALKFYKDWRISLGAPALHRLPGETKES